MTRNSKEKEKNVNRKRLATRSKRQAEQTASQAPTKRQPGAPVMNRLAVTGHCRAVAASFAPCLLDTAWRWDPSARRQCALMWQVGSFSSVFARGNDLWHFGGTKNTFGELGGVLGLVGTTPSSSLYLFLFHLFHFLSLSSPWQWRAKPIFCWG